MAKRKIDIVERLRSVGTDQSKDLASNYGALVDASIAAADEIEKLRFELETVRRRLLGEVESINEILNNQTKG